ncbi:MAG: hypothetical protein RBT36_06070 [Desulfobulbus sp.]|jgi:hypothetical protein|nr:hypothetical protein [Desulfobulbus sp.]
MYNEAQLCEKIKSLYPDIGQCGIDVSVDWNEKEKTWLVHLKKDTHTLEHFLETADADICMADKQCVSLGLEIAQLRKNIEGKQF